MRGPLLSGFSQHKSEENSWLDRVRENFAQLLMPSGLSATSANGAPLHLLKVAQSGQSGRAQGASVATHAAVLSILVLLAMYPGTPKQNGIQQGPGIFQPLRIPERLLGRRPSEKPSDSKGKGGNSNPIRATSGSLAPFSSIQIVRPILPDQQQHVLPVPPTILDDSAAPVLKPVDKIGLPWMQEQTNSPGPGKGQGIGSKGGNDMGDSEPGRGGRGLAENPYLPGVTMPVCSYCPDPKYSDEAREAKVQGTVTLQVLVGVNGRATEVRLVKGLGMGLDERAEQAVRTWHFTPAHDDSRHAVARWITIEAVYRLF